MSVRHVEKLHHFRLETLIELDDDGDYPDVPEPPLIDVRVCDECFRLRYPGGEVDDVLDADVVWPCPTIRALHKGNDKKLHPHKPRRHK